MQIESIASSITGTAAISTAARGSASAGSTAQNAIVEQTSSGYEAYVAAPPGPVVTGSSIEAVELRLNSTIQFQA
ncbi:hypothetical protein ACPOL_5046 [Acidisarcina polymorpha]|uniref:Uncharacterized protein n=1 Tax=Acidisarcina polymorpha TaxID=2211140 RepID=A0A2Z5G6L1_9BACT|nr:hypothetical protein [Acidisarcina polymorpha]AXC14304.1 hypothetical protein ACPOL_5046 [Acidisarcina polymorpha]